MSIKAVLFDKDGTLIDFADTFFDACANIIILLSEGDLLLAHRLAEMVDFDLDTRTCPGSSQIVGGTSFTIAQAWQPVLQRPSVVELSQELDTHFDKYTQTSVTEFVFTKPTLRVLGDMDIRLGVATNDSENNARSHLSSIGIEDVFSFVAGYDSGHGAKPEAGMVEAFIRHCALAADQVVMVGDSTNDLLAGKNAGALAVAITSGIAVESELRAFADHVIDDISKLPQLLVALS